MSLSAQAESRKEKLARMRALREGKKVDPVEAEVATREEKPTFKERNFDLETESTKLGYDANPTEGQETVELLGAEEEARTIQELMEKNQSAVDYLKLQPKRANWDLKRDLQEDLDQLDRETDQAIDVLVRERIRKATGEETEG
ncbi:mRNA splicing factor [Yarrowia lipolytica]|uniref:YALI0F31020p n=2 Tax=Yarrowia lipolytica TaxID=4952 RepID=B5RSM7_YARLI|nr:YALI0F31020p [Yarrowia lipolytica CLIB122]AOW07937.1 hypothetical protein YALI1_F38680g [Yarrowia lipolytica]KAB8282326.1 mRNA splicing factor [Yarrowia lipolytica]KAE8172288.1 mRNA splicing factor [Yarrowia lipolytica]KAJ8055029.1 mRNA splicing factor [Yarrowia lipolytica]RDW28891.1 mRNA splicing factor [Yarrowia lipolytica]|eukprot:XP_002143125.1 YALI0F31020p [Yarrowia lipolytica CLIB122]